MVVGRGNYPTVFLTFVACGLLLPLDEFQSICNLQNVPSPLTRVFRYTFLYLWGVTPICIFLPCIGYSNAFNKMRSPLAAIPLTVALVTLAKSLQETEKTSN